MNVKNIKSFVEFYESLGISTFISKSQRTSNNRLNSILPKKDNQVIVNDNSIEEKIDRLNILKNKVEKSDCGLKDIASNIVFSDGQQNSKIMFIGEAPGAEEDKAGKPFVGQAGKLLDKMLKFIRLDRKKNFYITNVVFWRPPGNRTPNEQEINICLPHVKEHIRIINPQLIILLGNIAAKSILQTNQGITKIRGKKFFYLDDENNLKIEAIPIFHPAYLLRNPVEKKHVWEDLKKIYKVIKEKRISLDG